MDCLICFDAVETYSLLSQYDHDNSLSINISLQEGKNSPRNVCSAIYYDCLDSIHVCYVTAAYIIFFDGNYFARVFDGKLELEYKGGSSGSTTMYDFRRRGPKTANICSFRADSNLVDESRHVHHLMGHREDCTVIRVVPSVIP